MFHYGDLIAWNTRKQTITVMSSTAAEVVAVSDFLDDLSTIREVAAELRTRITPAPSTSWRMKRIVVVYVPKQSLNSSNVPRS